MIFSERIRSREESVDKHETAIGLQILAILGAFLLAILVAACSSLPSSSPAGAGQAAQRSTYGSPEDATRAAFLAFAQAQGVPYHGEKFVVESNDGTYANVRVLVQLRRSAQSSWQDNEAMVEARKVGGTWQAGPTLSLNPVLSVNAAGLVRQKSQEDLYKTILRTPFAPDDLPPGWSQVRSYPGDTEFFQKFGGGRVYQVDFDIQTQGDRYPSTIVFGIFDSSARAQTALKQYQAPGTRLLSGIGDVALLDLYAPDAGRCFVALDKVLINALGNQGHGDERSVLDLANSAVRYLAALR